MIWVKSTYCLWKSCFRSETEYKSNAAANEERFVKNQGRGP